MEKKKKITKKQLKQQNKKELILLLTISGVIPFLIIILVFLFISFYLAPTKLHIASVSGIISDHNNIDVNPSNKLFTSLSDIVRLQNSLFENNVTVQNAKFQSVTVPILMYHHIREYVNNLDVIGENLSVTPANFSQQLDSIKNDGYTTILYRDLLNYINNGIKLPAKPIMLNFDDGYDNVYTNAFPILQSHGMKGSFGIITGFVGKPSYMTWEQIKDLKANGNEMVSHSVSHLDLSKIPKQKMASELEESKKTLDTMLNQDTKVLIYPSGKYNLDTVNMAAQTGYLLARTTEYGTKMTPDNLLTLPDIRMMNGTKISSSY